MLYKEHKPHLRDKSWKKNPTKCRSQLMIFPKLHGLFEHVKPESELLPTLQGSDGCVREARSN